MCNSLLAQIHQVVLTLPPLALATLTKFLYHFPHTHPQVLSQQILQQLPNPIFRRQIQDLLELWQDDFSDWSAMALATALQASAYSYQKTRQALEVELVWTGPKAGEIPIRRTEQVLLQLINETKIEVTLISFAVYKIPAIVQALKAALQRGIIVRIIAETPDIAQKIPFGIMTALSREILEQAKVYIWSHEKRLFDEQGRVGSLHIKGAIADKKHVLITSANLTEYALTLNMEMGLLVHSHDLASQVNQLFTTLIQEGTLVES